MGLSEWARDHLLLVVGLSLAFGTLTVVSVLGVVGWLLLALLGVGGASTLGTLLPLFLLGLVAGVPGTVVALIAAAVGLAGRASSAVSGKTEFAGVRLGQVATYVERESDLARLVGLSDLVEDFDTRSPEQRADERIERLKDRYVDGEISDYEFEQRMQRIMDEEGVHRDRTSAIDDELRATERN
ncbi:SHOCT domain-containing protein [Halosimplex salinum]|uniref:SHOCT domain-containing protein n=1 Tax=Halosimplex salinum TaxID=1710538 RepID=UPI000F49B6C2|nr:SHOCT domain-containing protein [Halosimplex salinum]